MAEYLSPGVYVEEFDSGPVPMQGVSTSIAGFIGVAEKGPAVGAPSLITGFADFSRKFGGYLQTNEFGDYRFLAHAVNHFFSNGGSKAFVVRVAPSDAAIAKIESGTGAASAEDPKGKKSKKKEESETSTAAIPSAQPAILIQARSPGVWGNSISVNFIATNENKSQIVKDLGEGKYVLKNAVGFDVGDVVVLEGSGDPQITIIKNVFQNRITLENALKGDVVDEKLLPTIKIKTCEINITIECDGTVEKYENVSFNISSSSFIEKKLSRSELVLFRALAPTSIKPPINIIKEAFASEEEEVSVMLKGGSNGTSKNLTDGDFIGKDEGPGARTGICAFLDNTDVNLMAVPGNVSANVQLSLVSHCEKLGSRFAVLDVPFVSKTTTDVLKHRDIVDSDYCAMYHPWLKVYDPLDKKDTFIPPSGSVLGIYARSDNSRGVHKAPANEVVANCTGLSVNYNSAEQDFLNPRGLNAIRKFPGAGIRIWGARTASSKPLWKYINVRRLFIYIEESIKSNTNWVVFEPNDVRLWSRVRNTIETFLGGIWTTGALVGGSPEEAFFVDIGPNTMTKDDIENGRLICLIGVAPVKPAEFVIFRITQKTAE
ncbi:MAG: phage tail sheath subtilisin-like domain-containing protein [Oscillospiraceae bacterium]|jgi:phage tail sheath protein FI|nr:phage tail sheath subtilisin-like domain-containing protein [Oscillospiraceae bacterium]